MKQNRIIYLIVLTLASALYLLLPGWVSSVVLMMTLILPVLSVLLSIPVALYAHLRLQTPEYIEQGDTISVQQEVTGWMAVLPVYGEMTVRHIQTGAEVRCCLPAELTADHCGGLECGMNRCRIYDYLGLVGLKLPRRTNRRIIVRPQPVPMKEVPELPRRLTASWRSKPGGGFSENYELRPYRPGDPLRQIHWKTTAKTGKLIYRETMEPNRAMALLQIDLSGTPEVLDRKMGRLRWMGDSLLRRNIPFDVQALTGDGLKEWPVTDGDGLLRMLDELLSCSGVQSGTVLEIGGGALWNMYIGGELDEA
jgi:uncharacterized protein (DUF58 family)